MLDTVLQTDPSSGALCIILGSCRLPKNRLSKAALPGRVVMSKAHFMVCRRKRKSSELPRGTESRRLKLAPGLLFVSVYTFGAWASAPLPAPIFSRLCRPCNSLILKERVDCFRALGHTAELRGEHRSERSLGLLTRARLRWSSSLKPHSLWAAALFRGPDTISFPH